MNANLRWLWWITPALALLALIGIETDWGDRWQESPAAPTAVEPKPVSPALLPEYRVDGGVAALSETVDRTLFNPTRRPAPPATATAGGQKARAARFVLTGTTLAGDQAIAFLKEVPGGKARTVRKGDKIDGMLVADVLPDRIRFSQGGETEELMLKVAAGPKTTIVAAAPAAAPATTTGNTSAARRAAAAAARAAAVGEAPSPTGVQQQPGRRRGSRGGRGAAESAAENPGNNPSDAWSRVYQRMQNGGGLPRQK